MFWNIWSRLFKLSNRTTSQLCGKLKTFGLLTFRHMCTAHQNLRSTLANVSSLTLCEWNILLFVSQGLNSKSIAIKANLMPKSIDNYKNRIGKKLGVTGYGKLIAFAIENRNYLNRKFARLHLTGHISTASSHKKSQRRKVLLAAARPK